jgi:hypothetical protein
MVSISYVDGEEIPPGWTTESENFQFGFVDFDTDYVKIHSKDDLPDCEMKVFDGYTSLSNRRSLVPR